MQSNILFAINVFGFINSVRNELVKNLLDGVVQDHRKNTL